MILDRKDQYYDATFRVGRYNSGTGSKEVFVEFLYEVSNIQDYTFGGNQTVTINGFYYVR